MDTPTSDDQKAKPLTWTLKMSPSQSDEWDAMVTAVAAATGRRRRYQGVSTPDGLTRKDVVEVLMELAIHDEDVRGKLIAKLKS